MNLLSSDNLLYLASLVREAYAGLVSLRCSHHVISAIGERLGELIGLTLVHFVRDMLIFEELSKGQRDVIGIVEDLLVEEVALEDGVGTSVEDVDEDSSDDVGEDEDEEQRSVDGAYLDHGAEDEEGDESGEHTNEELGDEHEAVSDAFDEAKLGIVLQHKNAGVEGGRAEAFARERAVDVGIAVDVADEAIEAGEAAANVANEALGAAVIASSIFHLFGDVLKDAADDPHESE